MNPAQGYCVAYRAAALDTEIRFKDSAKQAELVAAVAAENAKFAPLVANFHTDGHATAKEAQDCYQKYIFDTQLSLDNEDTEHEANCLGCNTWTTKFASVDGFNFPLCDGHRTRHFVETLYARN